MTAAAPCCGLEGDFYGLSSAIQLLGPLYKNGWSWSRSWSRSRSRSRSWSEKAKNELIKELINLKKFISMFLAFMLALACAAAPAMPAMASAAATGNIRVFVDGAELYMDVPPKIINDRTMVPIRAVTEAIGCRVQWVDNAAPSVEIFRPGGVFPLMYMFIGDPEVTVNVFRDGSITDFMSTNVIIDSPPVVVDDRTLVPLRFIAETFSFGVQWVDATQAVYLTSPGPGTVHGAGQGQGQNQGQGTTPGTGQTDAQTGGLASPIVGNWRCALEEADVSSEIVGYLRLSEDGAAAYDYGDGYGPAGMGMVMYRGVWRRVVGTAASSASGSIALDLSLDCSLFDGEEGLKEKINGQFSYEVKDKNLTLTRSKGDYLYYIFNYGSKYYKTCVFERDTTPRDAFALWEMSDTELVGCLRANAKEASAYLAAGMIAIVPNEISAMPAGKIGREVWLGTDHEENFVREAVYAVCDGGAIYKYDPIAGQWR